MLAEMSETLVGGAAIVGAAIITGPMLFALRVLDRRNSRQHAAAERARKDARDEIVALKAVAQNVADGMSDVKDDVSEVKGAVLEHISWHAHSAAIVDAAARS